MSYKRVAAVTGANKGIGLAIVRNLALQYPSSTLNNGPLLIYLAARDSGRGEQALNDIEHDSQLSEAKALQRDGGLTDVKYTPLDIGDKKSIDSFVEMLKERHPEGIDILVNNAGIAMDGFDSNVVEKTLATNYYGTLRITEAMLPHMRAGTTSRVVNISSMAGKLNKYGPEITKAFQNATSVSQITSLMESYTASVKASTHTQDGWPAAAAYSVSKAGVTGFTGIIGRQQKQGNALVNSCCPGYVKTDMTKGNGRKTVDQGAKTPVKLALGDLGERSGEFWEHEDVSQW